LVQLLLGHQHFVNLSFTCMGFCLGIADEDGIEYVTLSI
jgi:hypothetical protein